ncbi:phospho-sugar mutase [Clostridium cellulovorans]|uniref:Phosphoglucomutase n=1 Tax=Clostridium cellulovorans (strain ATCC 35296 / DSM 3052 / OCM 3 / 743B) TaxID=573061 RepID=D9SMZ7_CLOC7|nr:phospho-sugar mutase [Clostridium cellulovorans]ADL51863.1 phosphoglucomutase/phosphomannomutase alpha/beta/alpha domain I [Clostridium cellulovorans 743B]
MNYKEKYLSWLNAENLDLETKEELNAIKDEKEIEDRFYKDLEFGTGGLRGVIGAGSNRMNVYTVAKATQGFANYLVANYKDNASVTIAYDSRNMSKEFAESAACVLCANGIKVNLFESLRPTPMLSFAVRELKSSGGIVITASHNPKQYNGYKVYGEDGGQVTDYNAMVILDEITKVDIFNDTKTMDIEEAKKQGLLNIIGEAVDTAFINNVKAQTIREELVREHGKDLEIIYTPIHGTGNLPVRKVLQELGYESLHVVKEQELPDGNFPTAPYPNPENPQVFEIALEMAKEIKPDIIFGTDPDADRIGAVVKDSEGNYQVLSGNQTGVLLTHYIITSLIDLKKLPQNPAVIKTIVTSELATKICDHYGVTLIDVLTGFKYIGEKIKEFEETNSNTFLFGFEESYGALAGTYARDKDAVVTAMLICEMTLYYKNKGLSLYEAFIQLSKEFGYYKEELISIELQGKEGQEKIQKSLDYLRENPLTEVNNVAIKTAFDYKKGIETNLENKADKTIDLPKSNVLKYILSDDSWFVVRPSGTEPKMKVYLSVVGKSFEDSKIKMEDFKENIMAIINKAMV